MCHGVKRAWKIWGSSSAGAPLPLESGRGWGTGREDRAGWRSHCSGFWLSQGRGSVAQSQECQLLLTDPSKSQVTAG